MEKTAQQDGKRSLKRRKIGTVVSAAEDKTIRVVMENLVKHPIYGKYIRRKAKVAAHDPDNTAEVGDQVEIVPCRRLSRSKNWRLLRVVRKATLRGVAK
jgi:small subunit ribosomal protein S17